VIKLLKLEVTETGIVGGPRARRKVRVIGLGNSAFWTFIGFVSGYLLAALVAAPHWNR
jgi:hypothetical protein